MEYAIKAVPGSPIHLSSIDPKGLDVISKDEGLSKLKHLGERLGALQELMYAASQTALLVVFQGRDTAGKDGAINRLLEFVNVQSCRVVPFKVPTAEELSHDFLWRVHRHAPGTGGITVFNRSHYEDVLVVRVHQLVEEKVWSKRYGHINAFEALLTEANTIIVKFCLHISREEQEQRLLAREADVEKSWKLSVNDWRERELWDHYTTAYEDVINRCSTDLAPWYVVPADRKWYRDLAVAQTLVNVLEPYETRWRSRLEKIGEVARAELAIYRSNQAP